MRYAVIGTNWITDAFIEGAMLSGNMRLSAVYSRDIERARAFGAKYGVSAAFDDLYLLAAHDGIDAVYIASPNGLHYMQSKLFLENGRHVICEKPITVSTARYLELRELADRNGLVYMEAIMMMHHPYRETLREAIGGLGSVTTAHLDFSQFSSKYGLLMDGKEPNIFNPSLAAGCIMDMGVYCVYPALEWFGPPDEIYAKAGFVQTGADGYVNSLFVYKDKFVDISLSKLGQSVAGSEIMGDAGTITIEFIFLMHGVYIKHGRHGKLERLFPDVPRAEVMGAEADDFCKYAREFYKYETEYRRVQDAAYEVCRLIEAMRVKAGIHLEDRIM